MKIWKWKIPRQARFTLMMPGGGHRGERAEILFVASDGEDGFLWALVNPDSEPRARKFEYHLTGGTTVSATAKYLGSYRESDGFVAHIFEEPLDIVT